MSEATPERGRDGRVQLHHGDSREVLKAFPDASFHAVVTDPPYSLQTINKRFAKVGRNDKTWSRSGSHQRTARGFMNQKWDTGETAFDPEFWAEVGRVIKPGGHLLAFGGTRTYHRLACAIEDAGFEIRDCLSWIFGTGFPKSHNQKGDWEGWGTALKPAYEPIVLARWPMAEKTVAANLAEHRCGAINVDACRIATADDLNGGAYSGSRRTREGVALRDDHPDAAPLSRLRNGAGEYKQPLGRWPANVVHDSSEEVLAAFPDVGVSTGGQASRASGWGEFGGGSRTIEKRDPGFGDSGSAARFFFCATHSGDELLLWRSKATISRWNPELANTADGLTSLSKEAVASALNDAVIWASDGFLKSCPAPSTNATPSELRRLCEAVTGTILSLSGACWQGSPHTKRFPNGVRVRCAEPSVPTDTMTITASHWKSDGSAAPVTLSTTPTNTERGAPASASKRLFYSAKADSDDRLGSKHPTVKPVDLMRWLVRLVTPKGGRVLDPFAGSGTTGMACMAEGFDCTLIEREPEYAADIRRRLAHVNGLDTPLFAGATP